MPTATPIDYANAYFPNPTVPQIVGQPTFEKLRRLKKALKANAASVQSELGGGAFGHLGLVLDDATYHRLTQHHYVAPPHPGPLVIVAQTAHHEAVRLRDEHREAIQVFCECVGMFMPICFWRIHREIFKTAGDIWSKFATLKLCLPHRPYAMSHRRTLA